MYKELTMENTCSKDCYVWKKYRDKCPNYIVGYWREESSGHEKRVEDCAPRRILELLKTFHSLLVGLQKTSNAERDASNSLAYVLMEVVKKAAEGKVLINELNTETAKIPLTFQLPQDL